MSASATQGGHKKQCNRSLLFYCDDGWTHADMQNIDIALPPLVICAICIVTVGTGTEPKMWSGFAEAGGAAF